MATVMTIEGVAKEVCKRVKHGKSKRCTIERCKQPNGRWKFTKGSTRCKSAGE